MKNFKVLALASLFLVQGVELQAFGMPKFNVSLKLNLSAKTAKTLNQSASLALFGGLWLLSRSEKTRTMVGHCGFTNGEIAALSAAGSVFKAMEYVPFLNEKISKFYWGTFAMAGAYKIASSVTFRRSINFFCALAGEDKKPFDETQLKKDEDDQAIYMQSNEKGQIERIDGATRNNLSKALLTGAIYSLFRGPWFEFGKMLKFKPGV